MNIYTFRLSDGIYRMVGTDVQQAIRSLRFICVFRVVQLLSVEPLTEPLEAELEVVK